MKEARYLSVDGVRTHYFEAGETHRGKRPTILLLHSAEFGGCAEFSWERNLPAFAERYHVLAPDHLGSDLVARITRRAVNDPGHVLGCLCAEQRL